MRGKRVRGSLALIAVLVLLSGGASVLAATTVSSGSSVNSSVGQGSWKHYRIYVSSGSTQLQVAMQGSGDADLYVKYGSQPTTSSWNFRPYSSSTNETVTVTSSTSPPIQSGYWYLSVYGYSSSTSTFSLTATVSGSSGGSSGGSGVVGLSSGVPVSGSVSQSAWRYYRITVPSNATQLEVELTGNNDADLYVRRNVNPTTSIYDFRPYLGGSNETVTVTSSTSPALQSGIWYMGVRGYSSSTSNFTLKSTVTAGSSGGGGGGGGSGGTGTVTLSSGTPVSASVAHDAWRHYKITVPSGSTQLKVEMTGTNDADVYVKRNAQPTQSSYDFRPYAGGSNETVTVTSSTSPSLQSGTWYISVRGYSSSTSNFTVKATVDGGSGGGGGGGGGGGTGGLTLPLTSGVPANNMVSQAQWAHYRISVPSNPTQLKVELTGTNDADVYVRKGAHPNLTQWNFRPYIGGSTETVTVTPTSSPAIQSGYWYISVRGWAPGLSTFTLKATVIVGGSGGGGGSSGSGNAVLLTSGQTINGTIAQHEDKHYRIVLPAGTRHLTVTLHSTNGDADPYVRLGSQPTASTYDVRSYTGAPWESIILSSWFPQTRAAYTAPTEGAGVAQTSGIVIPGNNQTTCYILVRGYAQTSAYTLKVETRTTLYYALVPPGLATAANFSRGTIGGSVSGVGYKPLLLLGISGSYIGGIDLDASLDIADLAQATIDGQQDYVTVWGSFSVSFGLQFGVSVKAGLQRSPPLPGGNINADPDMGTSISLDASAGTPIGGVGGSIDLTTGQPSSITISTGAEASLAVSVSTQILKCDLKQSVVRAATQVNTPYYGVVHYLLYAEDSFSDLVADWQSGNLIRSAE